MQSYLPTWNITRKNIILQIPFSVISAQRKKDINMQKNWNVHWLTTCFKFKYPICGYSEGIITRIAEPEIGTGYLYFPIIWCILRRKCPHIMWQLLSHSSWRYWSRHWKRQNICAKSCKRTVPSNIYWEISKRSGFSVRYYTIFLPWQKKLPSHI